MSTVLTGITEADVPVVSRVISTSFGSPPDGADKWVRSKNLADFRVLRATPMAPADACLLRIPMGQYFGGRAVPMIGIAAVGVPPESRGRGMALDMMRHAVREIAAEGCPISTLYASTQALYRQVGYEQAGHRFITRIDLQTLSSRDRSMPVRALGDDDHAAVEACYRRFAAHFSGMLERGPYCWDRVRKFRDTPYSGYAVLDPEHPARVEGYLYLAQQRDPATGRHDVSLSDVAFTTARAARRLLGLLADFTTMGLHAELPGAPLHPLMTFFPQQRFESAKRDWWMVRVCNARSALESRGYPADLSAQIDLDLEDDLVPENAGRWTLTVESGQATFEKRRADLARTIRTGPRGLAAMFSGMHTPSQACLLGLVEGEPTVLDAAAQVFSSGGTPWMTDHF